MTPGRKQRAGAKAVRGVTIRLTDDEFARLRALARLPYEVLMAGVAKLENSLAKVNKKR